MASQRSIEIKFIFYRSQFIFIWTSLSFVIFGGQLLLCECAVCYVIRVSTLHFKIMYVYPHYTRCTRKYINYPSWKTTMLFRALVVQINHLDHHPVVHRHTVVVPVRHQAEVAPAAAAVVVVCLTLAQPSAMFGYDPQVKQCVNVCRFVRSLVTQIMGSARPMQVIAIEGICRQTHTERCVVIQRCLPDDFSPNLMGI